MLGSEQSLTCLKPAFLSSCPEASFQGAKGLLHPLNSQLCDFRLFGPDRREAGGKVASVVAVPAERGFLERPLVLPGDRGRHVQLFQLLLLQGLVRSQSRLLAPSSYPGRVLNGVSSPECT